ncbi:MAG: thiamine-monophosphate kinase [Planctomycetes bacterium]|nr:thiamine-monophosphate kinase [Planctomycetota bacterium]
MKLTEFGYIKWIQSRLGKKSKDVLVGSGDDAAAVHCPKGHILLATTDTIVEGIDFEPSRHSSRKYSGFATRIRPEAIGHKAVAVSLSDIAAMGGCSGPLYALITAALPKRLANPAFGHRLFNGMRRLCKRFNCRIIGGDLSSTTGPLVITSTIFGFSDKRKVIKRSGAKDGDTILVTGKLGGSILGKHLSFTPRLKEARYLNRKYKINSMIDISDGLIADLNHICRASKVGAILDEEKIPISGAARRMTGSVIKHALYGGEDFELLFTTTLDEANEIITDRNLTTPVSIIGQIGEVNGIYLKNGNRKMKIKPMGYTHF